MPALRQVDMWQNRMTSGQCDMLAARYPGMRWGWTMVIKNWNHEHLIRTDATSWSTLHNNKSAKHSSEDLSVLKYCWNLMALDVGHNKIDSLEFLYDLPNLRVLILACNAVTDITPIATLQHLEYAELFNNKITDITPLKDLPHLMDLNLGFNRIADLSPLENIKTLQRLWLLPCIIPPPAPGATSPATGNIPTMPPSSRCSGRITCIPGMNTSPLRTAGPRREQTSRSRPRRPWPRDRFFP